MNTRCDMLVYSAPGSRAVFSSAAALSLPTRFLWTSSSLAPAKASLSLPFPTGGGVASSQLRASHVAAASCKTLLRLSPGWVSLHCSTPNLSAVLRRPPARIRQSHWASSLSARGSSLLGVGISKLKLGVPPSIDEHGALDLLLFAAASQLLLDQQETSADAGARITHEFADVASRGVSSELQQAESAKPRFTNYKVIRMPFDGRCLFHAVSYGLFKKTGAAIPDHATRCQVADNLRQKVADEFVKRREETEWFLEGPFDLYVANMRQPHVWGGEPELLMMSHVLGLPITVYIHDVRQKGAVISIAEYGQDYANKGERDEAICVLYNGSNHYDAIQLLDDDEEEA